MMIMMMMTTTMTIAVCSVMRKAKKTSARALGENGSTREPEGV
jgi:hypothetical protein